ncbi:MAG: lipoyl(octanoyl) transferase LipB [Chitinophagales bacterium]|nr:lipoyl(octanoyl) transferase LipB [Chitinophagales bacterium]MDW8273637.1 lipoyl(octanoyl) transferase LipB [Chitinophagales bacterium]
MLVIPIKYFLISPYRSVLRYQESLFAKALAAKENNEAVNPVLIVCQHHPVYTLGKHGKMVHLLGDPSHLGAEFVQVNRGGDITFHGPGQMVVYPILDLDALKIGIAQYVYQLEETAIETLRHFEIYAERSKGHPGVWVGESKIAAVGIKVSRGITMHGMALNVNTDLSFFNFIVPCGIPQKNVTSMAEILGRKQNMVDVFSAFKYSFEKIFNVKTV